MFVMGDVGNFVNLQGSNYRFIIMSSGTLVET